MVEAVNPDFESLLAQRLDDLVVHHVAVLRDEVPRRPIAGFYLDAQELRQLVVTDLRFDIVGEHQSPGPPARPNPDEGDRPLRKAGDEGEEEIVEVVQRGLHRPAGEPRSRLHATEGAAHAHLDAAWQQWSCAVVTPTSHSGQMADRGRSNVFEVPLVPEVLDQLARVEGKNDRSVVLPPNGSSNDALLVADVLDGVPGSADVSQPGPDVAVGCDAPEERSRTEEVAGRSAPLGCECRLERPGEAGGLPAYRQRYEPRSRRLVVDQRVRDAKVIEERKCAG